MFSMVRLAAPPATSRKGGHPLQHSDSYISETSSSIRINATWAHPYNNHLPQLTPGNLPSNYQARNGNHLPVYYNLHRAEDVDWTNRSHLIYVTRQATFCNPQLLWIAFLPTYASLEEVYGGWLATEKKLDMKELLAQFATLSSLAVALDAFGDQTPVQRWLSPKPQVDLESNIEAIESGSKLEGDVMALFGGFLKLLGWCASVRYMVHSLFPQYSAKLRSTIGPVLCTLEAKRVRSTQFRCLWYKLPADVQHVGVLFSRETSDMYAESLIKIGLSAWDLFMLEAIPTEEPNTVGIKPSEVGRHSLATVNEAAVPNYGAPSHSVPARSRPESVSSALNSPDASSSATPAKILRPSQRIYGTEVKEYRKVAVGTVWFGSNGEWGLWTPSQVLLPAGTTLAELSTSNSQAPLRIPAVTTEDHHIFCGETAWFGSNGARGFLPPSGGSRLPESSTPGPSRSNPSGSSHPHTSRLHILQYTTKDYRVVDGGIVWFVSPAYGDSYPWPQRRRDPHRLLVLG